MTALDAIGLLSTGIAIIVGLIQIKTYAERKKLPLSWIDCELKEPSYKNSAHGNNFIWVTITPGSEDIQIYSVEVVKYGIRIAQQLSDTEQFKESETFNSEQLPNGPLRLNWDILSSAHGGKTQYANFKISNENINKIPSIKIRWTIKKATFFNLHRKKTFKQKLAIYSDETVPYKKHRSRIYII
jgi:hypothetical protein